MWTFEAILVPLVGVLFAHSAPSPSKTKLACSDFLSKCEFVPSPTFKKWTAPTQVPYYKSWATGRLLAVCLMISQWTLVVNLWILGVITETVGWTTSWVV